MALLSDIELTYTEVRCKSANQAWLAYEEKIGNITCFLDLNSSFLNQVLGISVKKSSYFCFNVTVSLRGALLSDALYEAPKLDKPLTISRWVSWSNSVNVSHCTAKKYIY